jgi:peptide/nickel transport system permease protein
MVPYIIRRILLIIPTLFLVIFIVFVAVRLLPADAVTLMVQRYPGLSQEEVERAMIVIREDMGLDVPIPVQFVRFLGRLLFHFDLGNSLWQDKPVVDLMKPRIAVSLQLAVMGMAIALIIAIPVGIFSAIRQDTMGDYVARSGALLLITLPDFWVGTIVMVFPALWWGWSPPITYVPLLEDPVANLKMFIIPATILGMLVSGTTMRMTRTMMLEVLRQDYIRTAWAKGFGEFAVVSRHAIKNAIIPILSLIGIHIPSLIGGQVILEQIFVLPGIGRLLLDAAGTRDYTLIMGINIFVATVILFANLVIDLLYVLLDPRIQYEHE